MMTEVIVYPDAELITVNYLRAAFATRSETYAAGVRVGTVTTNPLVPPLIVIRRSGGIAEFPRDRPRVDATVWHTSDSAAQNLAQLTRGLLHAMRGVVGGTTVYRVEDFTGPIPIPDPDTGTPRWLLSVELSIRGTAV
jgi:hypothetical protein